MNLFHSLSWQPASRPFALHQITDTAPLRLSDSAAAALIDFSRRVPLQVRAGDEALQVRDLLETLSLRWACVINEDGALIGIICLKDLGSRESVQRAQECHTTWSELAVDQLMLPITCLPMVSLRQLDGARVGDLIETLRKSESNFLLIGELLIDGDSEVTGVIFARELAERTGLSLEVYPRASSFAQIANVVQHPEGID